MKRMLTMEPKAELLNIILQKPMTIRAERQTVITEECRSEATAAPLNFQPPSTSLIQGSVGQRVTVEHRTSCVVRPSSRLEVIDLMLACRLSMHFYKYCTLQWLLVC